MKKLLFALSFILSFNAVAAISIISDLDDTIKITEASGRPGDLLGDDVYVGMPDFLKGAKNYAPDLYILSASPNLIRAKVKSVLKKRDVTFKSLILRKNLLEGKFEFKVKKIKEILDSTSDEFILIGDDVGKDPEVYAEIKRLYPDRILASYIHSITGRSFTSDAVIYWTSFDLSLRELLANRMELEVVEASAEKFIGLEDALMKEVFPKKAQCPKTSLVWEWQLETVMQEQSNLLIDKFVNYCLLTGSKDKVQLK